MRRIYALALVPAVVAAITGVLISVLFGKLQDSENSGATLRKELRANDQMVRYTAAIANDLYHSVWQQNDSSEQKIAENKRKLLALRDELRASTKGTELAQQYVVEDRSLDEFLAAAEQFRLPNGQAKLVVKLSDFQQQDGYLKAKLTELLEKQNKELNVLSAQAFNVVAGAAVVFLVTMGAAAWWIFRATNARLEKIRGHQLHLAAASVPATTTVADSAAAADDTGAREQYIRELDEAVKAFAIEQPEQTL